MLSWILIALAIAIIFGVIKIDDIKSQSEKLINYLKHIFSILTSWSKRKTAEIKSIAEQKKVLSSEKNPQEATKENLDNNSDSQNQ